MIRDRITPASAGFLVFMAACATPGQVEPPQVVTIHTVDTLRVVDTVAVEVVTESPVNRELEEQIARLQIQLLERDVLATELADQLDATRREVVRSLSRRQAQASRAEAASGMSEAEIAVQALGRAPGAADLPELGEARARMVESTEEFTSENYGGALYLAEAARALARTGQARLRGSGAASLQRDESLFALPVPLQTVGRSNVRRGPGLNFPVEFTLDGGSQLEGRSHTHQWVRVLDGEGREGWIFHTLVTSR